MRGNDSVAEWEASGARADYEADLEDAEILWGQHRGMATLSELRRVRRGDYGLDVELAREDAERAIRDLRGGDYEEFNPAAVPGAATMVALFENALDRALRDALQAWGAELLRALIGRLIDLGLRDDPMPAGAEYAQSPPPLMQPRRHPAAPRAPGHTASPALAVGRVAA